MLCSKGAEVLAVRQLRSKHRDVSMVPALFGCYGPDNLQFLLGLFRDWGTAQGTHHRTEQLLIGFIDIA